MPLRDLARRIQAGLTRRRVDVELDDELSFHIERETQKLMDDGVTPAEARAHGRARFGSPALVADRCRDERRAAPVEDFVRDVSYALRTFRRAPLAAVTVIGTVGLGLGLVAVVFTFFNAFVFRVDEVRNPDELFAVERPRQGNGERMLFTRPQYEALRRDTRVFSDAFALMPDIDSRIDGRMMGGTLVTGNFFQVLGVNATLGRTLTPDDDDRFNPRPVMVLSHRGWTHLFANDPDIIGRSLLVGGVPYQVVGVTPEGFRGLDVGPPDYWAPLSLLGQFRPIHAGREDLAGREIVGRLAPGVAPVAAAAALAQWAAGDAPLVSGRPSGVTLQPRRGTVAADAEAVVVFTPLFFAFGLILLIACANVANMLLARGLARQREIGIRLSLGASRRRVIRQLLSESLILALCSGILALAVSRLVLETAIHALMNTMAPDLAENVRLSVPAADWRVFLFLLVGAVASTALFGLAPALRATRLELVRTVRGETVRDARPGRARDVLIGMQVAASALLLVCAAVFLRSALSATQVDSGLRTADTVMIDVVNEPLRAAMLQAVASDPRVAAIAASSPDALARPRMASIATPAGSATVPYRFVSAEYFDVLGIEIVSGRGFSATERSVDAAVVMVSESTARQLWPNSEAVGQFVRLGPDPVSGERADDNAGPARAYVVIGVTRDVEGFRIAGFKEAALYLPTNASIPDTALTVRVHGDADQARTELLRRLTVLDPNMGQVVTMRTLARMETYFLQIGFWLTLVLGGLALVLTLSGLFSVLSYVVAQRRREMAVRIALGATPQNLVRLVLGQSLRPVAMGLAVGAGLAGAFATLLMATPLAAQIGAIVHVFDPVAYAVSLLLIVVACSIAALVPALRAARVDPMTTLKVD